MRLLCLLLALLCLSNCGIRGDLYLPDEPQKKHPSDAQDAPDEYDALPDETEPY